jgi:aldehyde:ferredoxin oxidoreductase
MKDYYGENDLTEEDILQMLSDYYDERGWDPQTGNPSPAALDELGVVTD